MKKLLILLFIIIILAVLMIVSQKTASQSLITPVASIMPITQKTSQVTSLNGDNKLNMTTKVNVNGSTQYNFSLIDPSGKTTQLFTKIAVKGEEMFPAHNSWSPNNKYVFLEDKNNSAVDYLLFKVNGEPFANSQKFLNVTALFSEKVKNYKLKAITGWDDPYLMHVQTEGGPPFWFDLTTESFIQLVR